jgi:hypothetical protein
MKGLLKTFVVAAALVVVLPVLAVAAALTDFDPEDVA